MKTRTVVVDLWIGRDLIRFVGELFPDGRVSLLRPLVSGMAYTGGRPTRKVRKLAKYIERIGKVWYYEF